MLLEFCYFHCHRLPGNVLWFEPPIVAGWDKDAGYWSTEDFHDLKFNEEKQVIQYSNTFCKLS
jgi:hypothetical protein